MAHLCHPHTAPPDDYFFVEPATGTTIRGEHLKMLVDRVIEHRKWKGITPDDPVGVRREIEAQICSAMPPGICAAEPGENYRPIDDKIRNISMDDLLAFSMASFRFIQSGAALVDKAESKRRADICRGCRFNRPSPCVVCTPVFKLMDAFIPADRVEAGLSSCGVCGCSTRAKILLPLNTIRDADQEKKLRFPPHCWLSENATSHGEKEKGGAEG